MTIQNKTIKHLAPRVAALVFPILVLYIIFGTQDTEKDVGGTGLSTMFIAFILYTLWEMYMFIEALIFVFKNKLQLAVVNFLTAVFFIGVYLLLLYLQGS